MQQMAREVIWVHHAIDMMARIPEVHPAHEETQWLGIESCLQEQERMWDDRHNYNIQWGMGITEMTVEAPTKARVDSEPQLRKREIKNRMKLQGKMADT